VAAAVDSLYSRGSITGAEWFQATLEHVFLYASKLVVSGSIQFDSIWFIYTNLPKLAAQFATTNPPRPEAFSVLSALREQGLSTWVISGDNTATAIAVEYQLCIPVTNIIAGVFPSEKADKIRWLQSFAPKRSGKVGKAIVAMT
jgi:cation transport ATPase